MCRRRIDTRRQRPPDMSCPPLSPHSALKVSSTDMTSSTKLSGRPWSCEQQHGQSHC